jgi:hypothetical protein
MRILGDIQTNLPREIRKKADYFKLNPKSALILMKFSGFMHFSALKTNPLSIF